MRHLGCSGAGHGGGAKGWQARGRHQGKAALHGTSTHLSQPFHGLPTVGVVEAAREAHGRGALTCTRASVRSVRRASCSRAYTSG